MNLRKFITPVLIALTTSCNQPQLNPDSDEVVVETPGRTREQVTRVLEAERKRINAEAKEWIRQSECPFEKPGEPTEGHRAKIAKTLALVNTHAISCDSAHPASANDHPSCQELRRLMGRDPIRLKNSWSLFSREMEHLGSFGAFEARIVDQLQPEDQFGDFSYDKRLRHATEILARCALGVYQILPREWFPKAEYDFRGVEGRKNMYWFLTSKVYQDEMVTFVINKIGTDRNWQPVLMAAEYYGGKEKVPPLLEYLNDPGKDAYSQKELEEKWPLIFRKRYRTQPPVMTYLENHEDRMRTYAAREGCAYDRLGEDARARFFRYALTPKESSFDMFEFEHEQFEKRRQ